MLPSLFLKMLLLLAIAVLMNMPTAYEARRLPEKNKLLGPLQMQGFQVTPISVIMSNPPTTPSDPPPSKTSQKAFTNDHVEALPLLHQQLFKGPITPSAPNPGTYIPSPPSTLAIENAALQNSTLPPIPMP